MGEADPRVVAGAALGSFAADQADPWSDLDLMFSVAAGVPVADVQRDWTATLAAEFGAVQLFDLVSGPIIYRVFMFPDCLELDLSFTPATTFRPGGPRFRLLFGEALERVDRPQAPPSELLGYAAHHVLHARAAIERGRPWLAEYWISAIRDHGLALACRRRGLDGSYGRDFDRLPADVLAASEAAIVRSLDVDELNRALRAVVPALLAESTDAEDLAEKVERQLRELASA